MKLLIIFISLIIHTVLYFGCELLQKNPHSVGWKVDEKIPTLYGFVYIYIMWMPLLALTPIFLSIYSNLVFWRYMLAWAINMFISVAFFIAYPTTFVHKKPENNGFTGLVCRTVFKGSFKYLNSAPSVHCSMSALFLIAVCSCATFPVWLAAIISIISVLIIFSTVLVKQHVLVDVVTAIPLAVFSWILSILIIK